MKSLWTSLALLAGLSGAHAATLLEHVESENGTLLGTYTGRISTPFAGVATYANNDRVEHATTKLRSTPTLYRIDLRGASSNASGAGMSVYVNDKKVGAVNFTGTAPSTQSVSFQLDAAPASPKIRFVLETDTGANDTFLDWYELVYVGDPPPPPPPPTLPATGAFSSGVYRNLFKEAGFTDAAINDKLTKAYNQLFHSASQGQMGESILINDPTDSSRAYIWNPQSGYNDVRTEGLSYGMMIALQMNNQVDFNKIWSWAKKYAYNASGDMKGYYGWRSQTNGTPIDKNPAPDGEEYFVTALFMAANRWGNGTGIFNYAAEANALLDAMYDNGQKRFHNGVQIPFTLFDKTANQVVFSPATSADRMFTDPSYHLPAFYELWGRWATNNKAYWASLAGISRNFIKSAAHPTTGLTPDYAYFDGRPHSAEQPDKNRFQYDAWRVIGNMALDYSWFKADPWQVTFSKRLQAFFKSKGANYPVLYELDGRVYNNNADHSPGLVAMNAVGSLASDSSDAWAFVNELFNTPTPSGEFRYYDGSLYMLGLLAASGNYKIYCPAAGCGTAPGTGGGTNHPPVATNDSVSGSNTAAITINPLANDTDADGDALSVVSNTTPANGTVTRTGNQFSYSAKTGFVGTDSFQYTISDGKAQASATVSVTVSAGGGGGGGGTGTLLASFEAESGTLSPSFRQPITSPFGGIILYQNGESASYTTNQRSSTNNYKLVISGASSNGVAATASILVNGTKVGTVSFTGSAEVQQTVTFTYAAGAITSLKFLMETDVGQSDYLMDWFKLYAN